MGSHRSNKHAKIQAKNVFDDGDSSVGMIADLLEKEENVKGLVDMFCLFVFQVAKCTF